MILWISRGTLNSIIMSPGIRKVECFLSVLFAAKSFLCWEKFHDLSVKLIPVQNFTAFYYPPDNHLHTIVIFYNPDAGDISQALFLLFHEAGHARQWHRMRERDESPGFTYYLNLDKGQEKIDFENEAWSMGRELMAEFIARQNLSEKLLLKYDQLYQQNSKSYADEF